MMTKEPAPSTAGANPKNQARGPGKKKRLADALRRNLAKRKDKKTVAPQGDPGAE
jgi:hypothetical protein